MCLPGERATPLVPDCAVSTGTSVAQSAPGWRERGGEEGKREGKAKEGGGQQKGREGEEDGEWKTAHHTLALRSPAAPEAGPAEWPVESPSSSQTHPPPSSPD